MNIEVRRILSNKESTLGYILINGIAYGWTCEDQAQLKKVKGETRIPEGIYKIALRKLGGHHEKYSKKFPAFHKGMLELQNVKDFQYILIHIGNTEKDTDGCILVGEAPVISNLTVTGSTIAYEKIYKVIIAAIEKGEEVKIKIVNIEPKS